MMSELLGTYALPPVVIGPEVVKSEPYGEKADVWAAGCILYQMATLNPPFHSTNMLSLATKIVEAVYAPVPEGLYSEKVKNTIARCLTSDAELRPDIVEVCSLLSDVMMKYIDSVSTGQLAIEKKLERERKRAQKYFKEVNKHSVTFQQLSNVPHERNKKSSGSPSISSISSCRSDFSESDTISMEMVRSGKKNKVSDVSFPDHSYTLDGNSKDIFSELYDELDNSDLSNSPSSCYFKEISTGSLKRSVSASGVELPQVRDRTGSTGSRPRPASAGIAVSQRKVRQISDPIQQILIQLHKIIYITQLWQLTRFCGQSGGMGEAIDLSVHCPLEPEPQIIFYPPPPPRPHASEGNPGTLNIDILTCKTSQGAIT
ncbi:serine threonine- kinase Nek10 isoform X3 [Pelobates cultripes]|uniref:Serine threonine- kinase Nek10 isoform X3 n=1 Tax=Pelobates cultripes TaxID=61616 RepID=A0AAD1W3S6_PELCU|nr:serine threonine- kinase Nek10 isoform X3 [Pelobates cultripes]